MKQEQLDKLRARAVDWDNSPMQDSEETRIAITCGELRDLIAQAERVNLARLLRRANLALDRTD